ncbi:hypothetical protein SAMCCGM7_pC0854 (plasmid) [Sinorhizobium americanum CCGM7]|nr:hypothetical protein SAMCCGM7_pC0854 [Sinorhizobium americanum CCGM7]
MAALAVVAPGSPRHLIGVNGDDFHARLSIAVFASRLALSRL